MLEMMHCRSERKWMLMMVKMMERKRKTELDVGLVCERHQARLEIEAVEAKRVG